MNNTLIRLNDVIGVFKNRKKFHIAKPVRDRIINYFQNQCQKTNKLPVQRVSSSIRSTENNSKEETKWDKEEMEK